MTKEQMDVYNRQYYLVNKESETKRCMEYARTHRIRIRNNSKSLRARNRKYINNLKSKPCMDCGRTFPPCAMEFDHRDRAKKSAEIARLAGSNASLETIKREIAKCDLVCSNCHRIRTFNKKQYLPVKQAA